MDASYRISCPIILVVPLVYFDTDVQVINAVQWLEEWIVEEGVCIHESQGVHCYIVDTQPTSVTVLLWHGERDVHQATQLHQQFSHVFGPLIIDIEPHIIGITESWANTDISDAELGLTGYVMFRKDRIGRRGGGVILYVKESIQAYEIKLEREADYDEAVWCKIV